MTPNPPDAPSPTLHDRICGSLLGLALGDCVGAAVEFMPRGSFAPVTGLTGGGTWGLQAGQYTDDTSMALCLAESLLECDGFVPLDQMKRYVRWWRVGHWSSTGYCFDIGNTTSAALARFERTGDPMAGSTDSNRAGNGSLMRLAPVVLFYAAQPETAVRMAGESSRTTHGAPAAVQGCRLFAALLLRALAGLPKAQVLAPVEDPALTEPGVRAIAEGRYLTKPAEAVRGSGYVVESLEAALWCFSHTESYREAVLAAANLGDDADTTAAITGQIAGAYYGLPGLPSAWLDALARCDEISALAEQLAAHATQPA